MTDSKHDAPKSNGKDKPTKNVDDVISRLLSNPPTDDRSDDEGEDSTDSEKE